LQTPNTGKRLAQTFVTQLRDKFSLAWDDANPVFEKTWSATKNVKSHVFWILKKNIKKRKKTYVDSQAT